MTANGIVRDERLTKVRELKCALEKANARAVKAEGELDALSAHFDLALLALRDYEALGVQGKMLIVDGWNAILKERNVHKLPPEEVKRLKSELLAEVRGLASAGTYARIWVVFDGPEENSFPDGPVRVSYTGGCGRHRADRLILDFAHCAFLLGLDMSRLEVRTSDKDILKKVKSFVR